MKDYVVLDLHFLKALKIKFYCYLNNLNINNHPVLNEHVNINNECYFKMKNNKEYICFQNNKEIWYNNIKSLDGYNTFSLFSDYFTYKYHLGKII